MLVLIFARPPQRTSQTKLEMGLEPPKRVLEHRGRRDMYLVQNHQAPLPSREKRHHLLRGVRTPVIGYSEHRVRRDDDAALRVERVLRVGRARRHLVLWHSRPFEKLGLPLLHRHAGSTDDETALLDRASRCDPDECFPGATRQNDDA